MTNMTPQERRSMRREQVERCLATTMTIRDWCELNKVPTSTMYSWMARFRKEEPDLFKRPNAGQWIELSKDVIAAQTALAPTTADVNGLAAAPIAAGEAADAPSTPIVVHLNGADIAVPAGAPEASIAAVLKAVAAL